MTRTEWELSRRRFLHGTLATAIVGGVGESGWADRPRRKAQIAITLDLEMSRHYPRRGMLEWDYQKGNLSDNTKRYALEAARVAKKHGGLIQFFCVGRVLEQNNVDWLKEIARSGHPVGNHTYDHIYLLAKKTSELQFRFRRAPWLIHGRTVPQVIRDNIAMTTRALQQRVGIKADGFRTPGGFRTGLKGRPDLQQMLLKLGFPWCSSLYPSYRAGEPFEKPNAAVYDSIAAAAVKTQPFLYPTGLVEIPMSPISDVSAFRSLRWKRSWFLKAIRHALERVIATGGVYDFLAHPSCLVVEDPRFETIRMICDVVKAAGDRAEIVSLATIARTTRQRLRKK